MVFVVVADDARAVLLFQAAQSVFQLSRPGESPGACQGVLFSSIGQETFWIGRMAHLDGLEILELRDPPRFGAVGQVAVGEHEHGGHVTHGDAKRLDRDVEAIRRTGRGQNGDRAFAVAAEGGLQQVRLLGLGGQAGGRAAPLNVHNHQGQFHHDRQVDGFAFQADSRAAGAGNRKRSAESRPDGRTHGGNLVLVLDSPHVQMLQLGQLVEQVAGRSNRVGTVDQRLAGQARRRGEAKRGGLVPIDNPVGARLGAGPFHHVVYGEGLVGLAVVIARLESRPIGLGHIRSPGKFLGDPVERRLQWPAVKPIG